MIIEISLLVLVFQIFMNHVSQKGFSSPYQKRTSHITPYNRVEIYFIYFIYFRTFSDLYIYRIFGHILGNLLFITITMLMIDLNQNLDPIIHDEITSLQCYNREEEVPVIKVDIRTGGRVQFGYSGFLIECDNNRCPLLHDRNMEHWSG